MPLLQNAKMARYAISKVDLITHPLSGRTVRAPVLLPYLFAAGQPLGWAEFHIDDVTGWCLCRLDGGWRGELESDADVLLLPDSALDQAVGSRTTLRAIRTRLGIQASVDDATDWRELLNTLGRDLGGGFDVDRWRAAP